jgi:hypothetical protein
LLVPVGLLSYANEQWGKVFGGDSSDVWAYLEEWRRVRNEIATENGVPTTPAA